jgi:glycosyltransferase involved in cell wall biosynthesis
LLNMTEAPAISVIIPVFNRGYCLADTLRSVCAQTFTDFEVVVVDDGSTDDSAAVARSFGERVRVLTQKNSGVSAARNAGLRAARGRFIAFQDSDDLWHPRKLEWQIAVLQKQNADWCAAQPVDQAGAPLFHLKQVNAAVVEPGLYVIREPLETVLVADCHPYLQSMMLTRTLVEKTGWFDEELVGPEDTEFIFRLAANAPMYFLTEPLAIVNLKTTDSLMRNPDPQARERRFANKLRAQEKMDAALPANSPFKKRSQTLLCYFLLMRAELACLARDWPLTRRLAGRGMTVPGGWRERLRCGALWFWPAGRAKSLESKWAGSRD